MPKLIANKTKEITISGIKDAGTLSLTKLTDKDVAKLNEIETEMKALEEKMCNDGLECPHLPDEIKRRYAELVEEVAAYG